MSPETRALTGLTAQALGLGPRQAPQLDAGSWERLFDMSCQQNVAALVCAALEEGGSNVPLTTKLKFAAMKDATVARHAHARRTVGRLLGLFNSHGIETMLLKGLTLSRMYPNPELRHFGDIDIYQYGRWREADRLASRELGVKVSNKAHHHSKYGYEGMLVENHYDFICRYGHRGSMAYERLLKREATAGRREWTVEGERCLLPPATLAALFYLRHMSGHFAAERVTVRHLTDWTFFCRAEGEGVDWELVRRSAAEYGFLPFAAGMERLCEGLFGHSPRMGGSCGEELARRMLGEIVVEEPQGGSPGSDAPLRRMAFKWRRLREGRWKHDLCYATPWGIDLVYGLYAKVVKPHTILH